MFDVIYARLLAYYRKGKQSILTQLKHWCLVFFLKTISFHLLPSDMFERHNTIT
jgi:hypothetical protein